MNPEFIHLMLNHVPVIGSLLATGILALGLLRRQEEIIRLSLYLFIFSAVAALPVYFSGEGAEAAVEHLPGVAEALIESHEDLAKIAIFVIEALGLASIGALILSFRKSRLPLWAGAGIGLLALVNSGIMAQTAHLGGQIRHTEIRQGATQSTEQHENKPGSSRETEAGRSEPSDESIKAKDTDRNPDTRQRSEDSAEPKASERSEQKSEASREDGDHD